MQRAGIRATGSILPGYPRLKLWQDAATHLHVDTANLKRVKVSADKYEYPVTKQFHEEAFSIDYFYCLTKHNQSHINIIPMTGMKKIELLLSNTFRFQFLIEEEMKVKHFNHCNHMANRIKCFQVERPSEGFMLEKLVNAIEENIRSFV